MHFLRAWISLQGVEIDFPEIQFEESSILIKIDRYENRNPILIDIFGRHQLAPHLPCAI